MSGRDIDSLWMFHSIPLAVILILGIIRYINIKGVNMENDEKGEYEMSEE